MMPEEHSKKLCEYKANDLSAGKRAGRFCLFKSDQCKFTRFVCRLSAGNEEHCGEQAEMYSFMQVLLCRLIKLLKNKKVHIGLTCYLKYAILDTMVSNTYQTAIGGSTNERFH